MNHFISRKHHDKDLHRYLDSLDDMGDKLAEFMFSGVHTKQDMIDFCISKGMKENHASELVESVLRKIR